MDNEMKAKEYDRLLFEYDQKNMELSQVRSNFNLTPEDEKKIKQLKSEMEAIQRKAQSLGSL
jgi:hypothetical protein